MNNRVVLSDRDSNIYKVIRIPLDTLSVGLDGRSTKTTNFEWVIEETGNVVPHQYFSQLNNAKVDSVLGGRDQPYTVLECSMDTL